MTRNFNREDIIELLGKNDEFELEDTKEFCKHVAKEFVDRHRWHDNFRLIFSCGDKFYATYISIPLTENCGIDDINPESFECYEVKKTIEMVEVVKWEKIAD